MENQADLAKAKSYLFQVLQQRADDKSLDWLEEQEKKLHAESRPMKFNLAFSAASRFFKKDPLQLTPEELTEAENVRKGFRPLGWDLLQTARTYLLLLFPTQDREVWYKNMRMLFETADMHEQGVLYAALPLLPFPDDLIGRTAEGIRTNITSVFDAVALHNPYPADFLDQDAWNQMVLKAVFMQRPLYRIYGADKRANEELARMLVDYAHERWAAGRKVMPELWRFVGPYINEEILPDIRKVVQEGEVLEKEAALLACSMSAHPEASPLLNQHPEIKKQIEEGTLNWEVIGQRAEADQ